MLKPSPFVLPVGEVMPRWASSFRQAVRQACPSKIDQRRRLYFRISEGHSLVDAPVSLAYALARPCSTQDGRVACQRAVDAPRLRFVCGIRKACSNHLTIQRGVKTLPSALSEHGGVIVTGAASMALLDQVLADFRAPFDAEGHKFANDFNGYKTRRLGAILGISRAAADLIAHPLVMEITDAHVKTALQQLSDWQQYCD